MTTIDVNPVLDPMANSQGARLWVERIGHRRYTGHNDRGARVEIGNTGDAGVFGPVELMKLALAGCAGLTADSSLSRRLGDDVPVTIEVGGPTDGPEDRVPAFAERLVVDLTGLADDEREKLLVVLHRAITEHCTVSRTLEAGASVTLTVASEG
ncbi:OsmC family protein [Cellulomonas sp. 73-92]|uniref:OsmC family protein n=1 Tax=Cellulomonas sp. 73-92 TaxID=1895740 RepID=UPI000A6C8B4A|nr:OsmC family protein [Cellulomonas sp. 73-92]